MSDLQQEAVRMISGLSDDNIRFLLEIIHRLIPQDGEKILLPYYLQMRIIKCRHF